ncbi:MAG: hypothetical protein SGJ17_14560 [Hyphomicrobiales bacterium]|nr:hypothetical protein [Hyphomicrobiales bacterium]
MLFDYARRKTEDDTGEPKLEHMYNAANLCGIRDNNFPEIHKTLKGGNGLTLRIKQSMCPLVTGSNPVGTPTFAPS